jgi:hypothetical protein
MIKKWGYWPGSVAEHPGHVTSSCVFPSEFYRIDLGYPLTTLPPRLWPASWSITGCLCPAELDLHSFGHSQRLSTPGLTEVPFVLWDFSSLLENIWLNNLKEGTFILAHGFRSFSPSWCGGHSRVEPGKKERGGKRKKGGRASLYYGLSSFSSFIPSRPSACGMVVPTFRLSLSHLINPLWKPPHRPIDWASQSNQAGLTLEVASHKSWPLAFVTDQPYIGQIHSKIPFLVSIIC